MKISRTIIIIFLTFFCFQLSKANEKIAFINIDIIFQNSITGKKITQNLNDFKKKNLDELKLKEDEILKKEKIILNQKNILSKEDFDKKINELKKEIVLFKESKNNLSIEFEKKRKEQLNSFMQIIRPVIEDYITKNSITLVFNQKNLFIADKKYDITDEILKIINKKS
tara:strand:+ start:958 stop:1464 length:507 start_codon:yes stop_codon:yes gene_type:complete